MPYYNRIQKGTIIFDSHPQEIPNVLAEAALWKELLGSMVPDFLGVTMRSVLGSVQAKRMPFKRTRRTSQLLKGAGSDHLGVFLNYCCQDGTANIGNRPELGEASVMQLL